MERVVGCTVASIFASRFLLSATVITREQQRDTYDKRAHAKSTACRRKTRAHDARPSSSLTDNVRRMHTTSFVGTLPSSQGRSSSRSASKRRRHGRHHTHPSPASGKPYACAKTWSGMRVVPPPWFHTLVHPGHQNQGQRLQEAGPGAAQGRAGQQDGRRRRAHRARTWQQGHQGGTGGRGQRGGAEEAGWQGDGHDA